MAALTVPDHADYMREPCAGALRPLICATTETIKRSSSGGLACSPVALAARPADGCVTGRLRLCVVFVPSVTCAISGVARQQSGEW